MLKNFAITIGLAGSLFLSTQNNIYAQNREEAFWNSELSVDERLDDPKYLKASAS